MKIFILNLAMLAIGSNFAQAKPFECYSADAQDQLVLKGEFNDRYSRVDNLELIRQDVVAFAIKHSEHTPTETASFKYRYPLVNHGLFDLNIEIWYSSAKKHLMGTAAVDFTLMGENRSNRIVLSEVSTRLFVLKSEVQNPSFKAYLDFRENYDDWASDKKMLGLGLICKAL